MGGLKIQTTFFLYPQWIPLDGWKKDQRKTSNCIKVVRFAVPILIKRCQYQNIQRVFKMCPIISNHKNVAQKLKEMTDIHWDKEKHLNKETLQTFQWLRTVY